MQYADNVLNILFFHPTIPKEIPNRSAPKDGGMSYRLQGSDPGLTVLRVHHHGNRVIKMARADWLMLLKLTQETWSTVHDVLFATNLHSLEEAQQTGCVVTLQWWGAISIHC